MTPLGVELGKDVHDRWLTGTRAPAQDSPAVTWHHCLCALLIDPKTYPGSRGRRQILPFDGVLTKSQYKKRGWHEGSWQGHLWKIQSTATTKTKNSRGMSRRKGDVHTASRGQASK